MGKMEKIEKKFMTFFKSSGQSMIKFNQIEPKYQEINGVNKVLLSQKTEELKKVSGIFFKSLGQY